ncbi:MAG: class A beta-lactamase, subclass A2 [Saprospiraceae bacterium]|nr:class A beta-lactamase, subclass A2 [Saprospiraceae bacterium]MBK8777807.1 class A beta-lactamase, subclass A2 [Saprospiraceae bacterium]MBK9680943.1 class A beta-lactamase, subclass A2 [Saprospiraceae bacterium]MBP7801433.1 class A beta-lactamase, subclass A2 [Saprospiraceae bacterium]MBP8093996.1 class A beta-lactamase, subclass A2 [Saprospiraceae bacterium]
MKSIFTTIFLISLCSTYSLGQDDLLLNQLVLICQDKKATIGFAIQALEQEGTITYNDHIHYPMQSVYKFHLALAVLNQVDRGKWDIDQKIWISKKDLLPDTWSPLRDKYPNGELYLPLREILTYTVAQSDNNGCDILFRLIGGPAKVNKYIHSLGIKDIAIKATEEQMHKKYKAQFANWTTPTAAIEALKIFDNKLILSPTTKNFLWNTMVKTTTGPNKLKGLLPHDAIVGHKTGYSGTNDQGITAASNDIGIMVLPNGKKISLAVFVTQSSENEATNDRIMAEVAEAVWNHFVNYQ